MADRDVLLSAPSPSCDIEAFVEQDATACYFYLWRHPNTDQSQMQACFVSNVVDKAHVVPLDEWANSNPDGPPALPYTYVTHSPDGLAFCSDELEIVWTQEGSGAGLFCRGDLVAFIPEWADSEFAGFSRYVQGTTPYGCDMQEAEEGLLQQLEEGARFWAAISQDYWPEFQQNHLGKIEAFIGPADKYFAIDGGCFPPQALTTGEKDGVLYGITLGVSALRQPMVESFYQETTRDFSRIELGFACESHFADCFMPVLERLSGAAHMPWGTITSLGHGHTIACTAVEGFAAIWLLNANLLAPGSTPAYDPTFGERVNLLWAIPITQEEYDFLLQYDMEKIFPITFAKGIHIFNGTPKVPVDLLKTL